MVIIAIKQLYLIIFNCKICRKLYVRIILLCDCYYRAYNKHSLLLKCMLSLGVIYTDIDSEA